MPVNIKDITKEAIGRTLFPFLPEPKRAIEKPLEVTREMTYGFPAVTLYQVGKTMGIQAKLGEDIKPLEAFTRPKSYFEIPELQERVIKGKEELAKNHPSLLMRKIVKAMPQDIYNAFLETGMDIPFIMGIHKAISGIGEASTKVIEPVKQISKEYTKVATTLRTLKRTGRMEEFLNLKRQYVYAPGETQFFAGVPVKIPKDIITKFKLTPQQISNIQKGITEGLAPAVISELTKAGFIPTKPPEVINYEDIVPTKALNILNRTFATLTTAEIPEKLYGKITLGELINKFEDLGIGEEIIKESNIALQKAGYKKIGNILLTERGAVPEKPTKAPTPKTLTGEIIARGGLDPGKLSKDYNLKEIREQGLGHILKKGGLGLDDVAKQLQLAGTLRVPKDVNPGDYLLEQVKIKEVRRLPVEKTEKAFAREERAYLKERPIEEVDKSMEWDIEKYEAETQEELTKQINAIMKEAGKPSVLKVGDVKKVIREETGQKKIRDIIEITEAKALRDQLKMEAFTARKAFTEGREIGIEKQKTHQLEIAMRQKARNEAKVEIKKLITEVNRMSEIKMDLEYKERIDTLLENYDFKRRTAKTLARRESMRDFIERQKATGEPIYIPDEQLEMLDKVTLNDMTLNDLRGVHQTIGQIAHLGKLKNKLIAYKEARDYTQVESAITDRVYQTGKKEPSLPEPLKTPSMRKRSLIGKVAYAIDGFAAHQRKTEFIARTLDGFKKGVTQENLIEPVQEAYNQEAVKQADVLGKLVQTIKPIITDFKDIISKQYDIEGIPQKLTKAEAMAVYANSKSPINREYGLVKGWGWADKQIGAIIDSLSQKEKAFVDSCMELSDSLHPETVRVGEKLTGLKVGKREGYWPKVTDKELSTLATLRQKEADLFQDVMKRTYVERGFTKEIGKVGEPVSLDFFGVLLDHINKVIHFQTHALPVRDVQKLIHSPKIKQAIINVLGENIYRQFAPWLKEVANPKMGWTDPIDKWAGRLKRNTTATTLGIKISVSLKQFGSFTQTIHEIGLYPALRGFVNFYKHPFRNIRFVYEKSAQMRFREKTFDREIREWMESKTMKELVAGRKGMADMVYVLIKTVDKAATLPSWFGAYQKNYRADKDIDTAVKYADGVVRRTQPAGSRKDLAAIMRGPNIKKLFTMFYTHFTNVYNQMSNEMLKLRMGEKALPLRAADLLTAWWWLLIVPGILSKEIATLGKAGIEELAKGIASYGLSSIAIAGNFLNSLMDKFEYQPSPAMGLPTAVSRAIKGKKPRTKIKHGIRATGYVTGLPMQQAWITGSGLYDLLTRQTKDLRRLAFSEYQLKGDKKKEKGLAGLYAKKQKSEGLAALYSKKQTAKAKGLSALYQ